MGKLTLTQGQELVDSGLITQKAFDKMQGDGVISMGRSGTRSSSPKRVFEGTDISPQLYFKGMKGAELSDEQVSAIKACREAVSAVIDKHTILAS